LVFYNVTVDISTLKEDMKTLAEKKETDKTQWARIGTLMEDVSRLKTFHEDN
tara:strand:- start:566 stop:721 length:156 start_codon:yes stop_codon:yes gene_type:complete